MKNGHTFIYTLILYFSVLICTVMCQTIRYVDINNAAPSSPYISWGTAANTIQDAINASIDNDIIMVSNGVYETGGTVYLDGSTIRIIIDKKVELISVNGPLFTSIVGSHYSIQPGAIAVIGVNLAASATYSLNQGFTFVVLRPFPENSYFFFADAGWARGEKCNCDDSPLGVARYCSSDGFWKNPLEFHNTPWTASSDISAGYIEHIDVDALNDEGDQIVLFTSSDTRDIPAPSPPSDPLQNLDHGCWTNILESGFAFYHAVTLSAYPVASNIVWSPEGTLSCYSSGDNELSELYWTLEDEVSAVGLYNLSWKSASRRYAKYTGPTTGTASYLFDQINKKANWTRTSGEQDIRSTAWTFTITPDADTTIRSVYITNGAVIKGFTIKTGQSSDKGGNVLAETNATIKDCIIYNGISSNGGGIFNGQIYNSFIVNNSAVDGMGGGIAGTGNIYNCTITKNTCFTNFGGGLDGEFNVYNSILYDNTSLIANSNNYGTVLLITNSCTVPLPSPVNSCIDTDPKLIHYKGPLFHFGGPELYFRINSNSPCINTGSNMDWMNTYTNDIYDQPRISRRIVDMGVWEYQFSNLIYGASLWWRVISGE